MKALKPKNLIMTGFAVAAVLFFSLPQAARADSSFSISFSSSTGSFHTRYAPVTRRPYIYHPRRFARRKYRKPDVVIYKSYGYRQPSVVVEKHYTPAPGKCSSCSKTVCVCTTTRRNTPKSRYYKHRRGYNRGSLYNHSGYRRIIEHKRIQPLGSIRRLDVHRSLPGGGLNYGRNRWQNSSNCGLNYRRW